MAGKASKSSGTGSRALPDLVARIRLDSSGVDAAISNLIGGFGRANLAVAGLAAGIGILIVGGKSMIEIAQKHADAEGSLAQAIASRNDAHAKVAPNMSGVTKATKELSAAQRELAEFDAGHHGSSSRVVKGMTNLDKMRRQDIETKIAQARTTQALTRAQRELAEFDLAHRDKVIAGSGLSRVDQMHREDIVAKVTEAQQGLAAAQAQVNKQQQITRINQPLLDQHLKSFLTTNRRYINDQSEVIDGAAKLIRSGLSQEEVEKDLNRALDLSALKHISLSDAVDLVNNAEHGRLRGLIDLGITTNEYVDSQGNLVLGEKDVAKAMQEFDQKSKGGRNTLSELQQHSNELSNDWQDLSNKGGPALVIMLDVVVQGVTKVYDAFDRLGKDDNLWSAISDRLSKIGNWIRDWIIIPLQRLYNLGLSPNDPAAGTVWQTTADEAQTRAAAQRTGAIGKGGRAAGGPMIPGGVYSVGEESEETVIMHPGGGGTVVSGGGRRHSGATALVHLTHDQPIVLDGDVIGRYIDRRVAKAMNRMSRV